MITTVGLDSKPLATVLWMMDGEARFKTVCYSDEEVMFAIQRANTKGDFHYGRKYVVIDH